MPRIGLKCEMGQVTDDFCRTCRQDPLHPCSIPAPKLALLTGEGMPDNDDVTGISYTPSRLLGCFRQGVLERDNDYYLDVHNQKASMRGTVVHAGMDAIGWPGERAIAEKRIKVPVRVRDVEESLEFSAKPDSIVLVDEDLEQGIVTVDIWDWKTREFKPGELLEADVKHRQQVWMYAWAVSKTPEQWYAPNSKATVHIRSVNIAYMSNNNDRIFSSLGTGKATIKRQRPARFEEIELAVIPTVLMPDIERFIINRIKRKQQALTVLAAPLEGDDAKWCYRCPVATPCGFWQRQREEKAA
jgi:hypothetical protein